MCNIERKGIRIMKKRFKAKAMFLGFAAMAAGAVVSAPALMPSQAFAATEAVQAADASASDTITDTETKTVVWTIRCVYKLDNGSTKPVKSGDGSDFKVTRSATFTRSVVKNAKTGKVVSGGDWAAPVKLAGYEAPAINGYTPDKSYIDGITVAYNSKPADTVIYYTEKPENKKTAITEDKEVSRKITYYRVNDDGSVSQIFGKTQRVTFTRTGTVDGNGKKTFSAWSSYTWPAEEVSPLSGYTPDSTTIPAVTFTPDNPPKDVNVYFRKDTSQDRVLDAVVYVVTFTDGMGNTLKTEQVEEGKSVTAPSAPKRSGYTFNGWDKSLTNVRQSMTVSAKWVKNASETITEKKHVERKIYYYYADGKKIIDTTGKHAVATQYADFVRYNTKDSVTGKITYGEWKAVTWDRMDAMYVQGYTPSMSYIPAVTFTPDKAPKDINVYYTKNDKVSKFSGYKFESGRWAYYKNGSVDKSFNGLKKTPDKEWRYFTSGVQDNSYTGLAKNDNGWFYLKKGAIDYSYTGMAKSPKNGKWYYVSKGKIDYSFSGLAKSPKNGKWFYMNKGVLDYSFTGVAKSPKNGKLYYVKKSVIDTSFSGTIKYNGKTYKVTKGVAKAV